jgi:fatty-acid desaturase
MKKLRNSSMLDDYDDVGSVSNYTQNTPIQKKHSYASNKEKIIKKPHVGDWTLIENATYDSRNHVVHLTEDLQHQKGAAIYQRVFNWKEIMIEFDYYMYGGKLVTL